MRLLTLWEIHKILRETGRIILQTKAKLKILRVFWEINMALWLELLMK